MSLRKRVQRQLEFYLSASNLRRDKFLQQNRDKDGFLSVQLFLRFNKIIQMKADNEKILLESAEKSPLIRVNMEQKKVAPLEWPLEQDDDSLERTVYIERFEAQQDHDSLRRRFTQFGKVNLVSLPRFKSNQQFKGFGFVEFATKEAADRAAQEVPKEEMRVMTKRRWLELKQALKTELRERLDQEMTSHPCTPAFVQSDPPSSPSKEKVDAKGETTTAASSSKRHHLRFDEDPEETSVTAKKPRHGDR